LGTAIEAVVRRLGQRYVATAPDGVVKVPDEVLTMTE
jgi:hypothetical protein